MSTAAATAAAVLALSGCGGGGGAAAGAGAGAGTGASAAAAAAWHAAMQCIRSHGYPSLRDPQIDSSGGENFGAQVVAVKRAFGDRRILACKTYLKKIPNGSGPGPPTPAELHQLVLFAQCIRRHGTPDWPDPSPNGAFLLPLRILNQGKPGFLRMSAQCRSLWNGKISIVSTQTAAMDARPRP
jgi:hypothetical protein